MKALVSLLIMSLALAVAAPAIAGKITTKAACEAAGGTWDSDKGKCSKKRRGGY